MDHTDLHRDVQHWRNYVVLLARTRIATRFRGKVDVSDVVQQTMLEAHQGRQAFCGGSDGEYAAWLRRILARNLCNMQRDLRLILDLGSGPVRGIHFSHDSQQLICGCADGLVRILDLISGKVSLWKGHKAPIRATAISPRGDCLATLDESGCLRVCDLPQGLERFVKKDRARPGIAYTSISMIAFAPDGKIVASASVDKTIRLWDVVSGDERATLKGHDSPIYSMAFSRDGKTLASGDTGGTIRLWRATTDEQTKTTDP